MPLLVSTLHDYVSVCCRCGCALKEVEMAARMKGVWEDLEVNQYSDDACLIFCSDCKKAVRQYATESVRKAWVRMQALEHP
jgi:hypothetical protein